jgi:hypothetical protein
VVADWFGDEPRFIQKLPESIREAGEVVTGQRRADTWIDAHEEHAHAGTDAIAKRREQVHVGSSTGLLL